MSEPAQATNFHQTDEQRIRDIYKEFEASFRRGDLDGMLAPIYERAIFAWDQIEVIGREALREAFVANLASVWKDADATHTINGVEFVSPDAAIAWGNYVVVLKDGSRQTGHIMNTFIRHEGEWLPVGGPSMRANKPKPGLVTVPPGQGSDSGRFKP